MMPVYRASSYTLTAILWNIESPSARVAFAVMSTCESLDLLFRSTSGRQQDDIIKRKKVERERTSVDPRVAIMIVLWFVA